MKKCFSCRQTLPLDSFSKSNMKYQLKSDMGTVRVCKTCTFMKTIKTLSKVQYNYEDKKFEVITFDTVGEVAEYFKKNKLI